MDIKGPTCPETLWAKEVSGRFKKVTFSPAQPRRAKTPRFRGQGRSPLDARSVLVIREYGKRARTPLAAFFNRP